MLRFRPKRRSFSPGAKRRMAEIPQSPTELSGEHLRFVLGLKLKSLRQEQGAPLKAVAARSGLSISYLSEIEKGKKYPTPEKLIRLARALDISFDALVSQQVAEDLDPVKAVFASGFLSEFPFDLFGIAPEDLFHLVTQDPNKAGALLRTVLEIGRIYDVHVEHFVLAREVGYRHLGLAERAVTSTWIKVESFEQVLNNFKASYFAGALLIDAESLRESLQTLFGKPRWDGAALLACMRRYDATPETFFHRLTQLVPQFFGLREIFFLRFN